MMEKVLKFHIRHGIERYICCLSEYPALGDGDGDRLHSITSS